MSLVDPRLELADHTPDAGGALVAATLDQHRVIIRAPAGRCSAPGDQAALYNLANLAARLFAAVELDVPGGVPWSLPLSPGGALDERISSAMRTVSPVAAAVPKRDFVLAWGADPGHTGIAGDAAGWSYSVSAEHIALTPTGGVDVAAVAASSLMVGQLFASVLAPLGTAYHPVTRLVSNLLDYRNVPAPADAPEAERLRRLLLGGAGSVGSSFVYATLLGDVPGGPVIAVDPDEFSPRNQLRYPVLVGPATGPKVDFLHALAAGTGLEVQPHVGDIRDWLAGLAEAPAERLVLSSVDTVEGRRDATDVLARRTVNCGVAGMALHVAGSGFGEAGCAFCQYVETEPALSGAAMLAQAVGLPVERVIAIQEGDGRLEPGDVQFIARSGVLRGSAPRIGERLEDLRRRAYAQASVHLPGAGNVLVSAPHVSAMAGALMLAEALKDGSERLAPYALSGRVDFDMSGQPSGFALPVTRDPTRRCLCWSGFRRRAYEALHSR